LDIRDCYKIVSPLIAAPPLAQEVGDPARDQPIVDAHDQLAIGVYANRPTPCANPITLWRMLANALNPIKVIQFGKGNLADRCRIVSSFFFVLLVPPENLFTQRDTGFNPPAIVGIRRERRAEKRQDRDDAKTTGQQDKRPRFALAGGEPKPSEREQEESHDAPKRYVPHTNRRSI
jgi:hypothetical protein